MSSCATRGGCLRFRGTPRQSRGGYVHHRKPKKASWRRGDARQASGETRGDALDEWWARENDVTPAPAALADLRCDPRLPTDHCSPGKHTLMTSSSLSPPLLPPSPSPSPVPARRLFALLPEPSQIQLCHPRQCHPASLASDPSSSPHPTRYRSLTTGAAARVPTPLVVPRIFRYLGDLATM